VRVKNSPQVSLYVILPEVMLGGLKDFSNFCLWIVSDIRPASVVQSWPSATYRVIFKIPFFVASIESKTHNTFQYRLYNTRPSMSWHWRQVLKH